MSSEYKIVVNVHGTKPKKTSIPLFEHYECRLFGLGIYFRLNQRLEEKKASTMKKIDVEGQINHHYHV